MSEKLTVWVFQTGEPLPVDEGNPRPMRAINLTNALLASGHNVVLWSSSFNHQKKIHRTDTYTCIKLSDQLEVRLIPSPGYKKNIGLARLWDHFILALNLKRILKNEEMRPDVAFIGYPPIEAAAVMGDYLEKMSVPSLLDVKDQWPSFMVEALPVQLQFIGRVVFSPYFYIAKRVMRKVTGLSAMATDFLSWARKFSNRLESSVDRVVPLTTTKSKASKLEISAATKWWSDLGIIDDSRMKIMFVGAHYPSLDFSPIFDAAELLNEHGIPCDFVICGHGDQTDLLLQRAKEFEGIYFPGWVDRPKIEVLSSMSVATLAPFKNIDCFVKSLPNKVIDSLSLGLPIISPLGGEVNKLIESENVGLVYEQGDGESLYQCIADLYQSADLIKSLSENATALYENKYSYEIVYGGLVQHLESMSKTGSVAL